MPVAPFEASAAGQPSAEVNALTWWPRRRETNSGLRSTPASAGERVPLAWRGPVGLPQNPSLLREMS